MPAAQDAFDHCRAGWLELIAFAAALAGALALRPWRLLTPGARGRLVPTLLVLAATLPLS